MTDQWGPWYHLGMEISVPGALTWLDEAKLREGVAAAVGRDCRFHNVRLVPLPAEPAPPPAKVSSQEPPAIALLRESAERFREYEAKHRSIAYDWRGGLGPKARLLEQAASRDARDAKADRDADLAARIEAFLAERERLMAKPEPKPEGGLEL